MIVMVIISILLGLSIVLCDLFGLGVFSPMFFELREAGGVGLVVIALKGDMAINADEGCGSASSERVLFDLLFF